jgi:hypothetical protein
MGWKLFQIAVALSVPFATIYWDITDNWYLVTLASIVAVVFVMLFANAFIGLWDGLTWAYQLLAARLHKRIDQR